MTARAVRAGLLTLPASRPARAALLASAAFLVPVLMALPAEGAEFSVVRKAEGLDLTFRDIGDARAEARTTGGTLTIAFDRPLEIDLAEAARSLAADARFIRQTADRRLLSIGLTRSYNAVAATEGGRVLVRLTPGDGGTVPAAAPTIAVERAAASGGEGPKGPPEMAGPELTVIREGSMTRLSIAFPRATAYGVEAGDEAASISFNAEGDLELAGLRIDAPPGIASAETMREGRSLVLRLGLAPGALLRHRAEGNLVILDILQGESPKPAAAAAAPSVDPSKDETQPAETDDAGAPADGDVPAAFAASAIATPAGLEIQFPWGAPLPAAVVRRGERLWVAFAAESEIDLSALENRAGEGVFEARAFPSTGGSVIGFKLAPHLLATAMPDPAGWKLILGDAVIAAPADIALARRPNEGTGEVQASLSGKPETLAFIDPDTEEELHFVLVPDTAEGVINPRRFVDFDLPATAQGLVIRPRADGVRVETAPGLAVISSADGLKLSGISLREIAGGANADGRRPSPLEMNFSEWRGPPDKPFDGLHRDLMINAAEAADGERPRALIDLARFLLAHDLAEEAIGVIATAISLQPELQADIHVKSLRGVADIAAGRFGDASRDLNPKTLPDDPHAALWLAMLAAGRTEWPEARLLFERAERAIPLYEPLWQMRFRTAAARAAAAVNDLAALKTHIDLMPSDDLDPRLTAEAALLRARLAEGRGDYAGAAATYRKIALGPVEPVSARAELELIRLGTASGDLKPGEAIDRLEALRFRWRGDDIEQETLIALAAHYSKIGDHRHALSMLRLASRHFPGTPQQRRASAAMSDLFEHLFLEGGADELPPIQALGLYYDYKELTPIGPKGDAMIRRLTDRLVALDLLDQASELLQHQVDTRLRGVARASVAVRLGMIQLLNRNPEATLRTMQSTRQSRLPDSLAMQRRLIEARALFELGRTEHALDLLSGDTGAEVDRLRAELHWRAKAWRLAAAAYESLAGADGELTEARQMDVLRAAIAFSLAGDRPALERLRRNWGAAMENTPNARGFAIVTDPDSDKSGEFRTLAERIAQVPTLEAFMADMKRKGAGETAGEPQVN